MTIITIQANDLYGHQLYQKLKADKNLKKVTIDEPVAEKHGLKEVELTLPGREMTNEELLTTLTLASRGKSISLNEARKKTAAKIALWRKTK